MVEKTIRILSIDGGGIRGIIPARVLQDIEVLTGKPSRELFHLISGTSTGGIIGCGLVVGKSAKQMGDLYVDEGGSIFQRSLWDRVVSIGGLGEPDYSAAPLESILYRELGKTWLSQIVDPQFGNQAELLIPSYAIQLPPSPADSALDASNPRMPYFFKSWKARGIGLDSTEHKDQFDFSLWAVARATSAAPTYFPPALIMNAQGESYGMIDGAMFANNPAMCALASAAKLYPDADKYMVVSLGTGGLERPIPYNQAKDWGVIGWGRPVLNILMHGSADTVSYELDQFADVAHFRFQIALGRTLKQDPDAANEDLDDASPDNIKRLEAKAAALIAMTQGKIQQVVAELQKEKWDPAAA